MHVVTFMEAAGGRVDTTADTPARRVRAADTLGIEFDVTEELDGTDPGVVEGDILLADAYTATVDSAVQLYADAFGLDLDVLADDPVDYARLSVGDRHVAGALAGGVARSRRPVPPSDVRTPPLRRASATTVTRGY